MFFAPLAALAGFIMLAATPLAASEFQAGDLIIKSPWSRATPSGARVAGGYFVIENKGTQPDRLVAANVEVAGRVEIHTMTLQDGVMRMRSVSGGVEIRPGENVVFQPSGLHLMWLDLARTPKMGDVLNGGLTFEKAGNVAVQFRVAQLGATSPTP
ncbi:MAG: copper chaperone PCu(A)C [Rhabdaerophilum sp.]